MAVNLPANETWFTFSSASGNFAVYAFKGHEEVNEPYEFDIELVSRSSSEDMTALLGSEACLSIRDRSGGTRLIHGLITAMDQGHTANSFTHYHCKLVPRLYFLDKIRDHRIFQNLSAPDIIALILKEQGFTAAAVKFSLFYDYEPLEYSVQYGETDLHFISRLCEEEGIYFFFEHSESGHTLCFCDREGGPRIAGESDIRFFAGSGSVPSSSVIHALTVNEQVNSNASAYREWNFEKPKLNLSVEKKQDAPVPPGMKLEQYRYPHLYQLQAEGTRYADLQVRRQLTFRTWIEGRSDISRFLPASTFSIHEHRREAVNAGWWTVSVRHEGSQPQVLQHEDPDRGFSYQSTFTAIPEMTRFIPALRHPRNRIYGQQTAIVTGPAGEEIYPDKHGRVKVQFFWDRTDQWNEKTTCWIRVSQGWAGGMYGAMTIPRIGHEVIVSFLEGNPDRPIITGRVYHELNKPPYPLPEHKTRSVFKSMSTPGEENEKRGFNEFRIEDKKGVEEIYVHAEKDVNLYVKNDWKERILHDRHQTVDNFTYLETKGETHETLRGQRKTELFANDNLTVHADSHTKVDGKLLGKVGTDLHIKAGQNVVIEAVTELTLKGGAGWVKLDPFGVRFGGPKINLGGGGSPGTGSGAKPLLPEMAGKAAESEKPIAAELMGGDTKETPETAQEAMPDAAKTLVGRFIETSAFCCSTVHLEAEGTNISDGTVVRFEVFNKIELIATASGIMTGGKTSPVDWRPQKNSAYQSGDVCSLKVSAEGVSADGENTFTIRELDTIIGTIPPNVPWVTTSLRINFIPINNRPSLLIIVPIKFNFVRHARLIHGVVDDLDNYYSSLHSRLSWTPANFVPRDPNPYFFGKVKWSVEKALSRKFSIRLKNCAATNPSIICDIPIVIELKHEENGHPINVFKTKTQADSGNWGEVEKERDGTIRDDRNRGIRRTWVHEIGHVLGWFDEYRNADIGLHEELRNNLGIDSYYDPERGTWFRDTESMMGNMYDSDVLRNDYYTYFKTVFGWNCDRKGVTWEVVPKTKPSWPY